MSTDFLISSIPKFQLKVLRKKAQRWVLSYCSLEAFSIVFAIWVVHAYCNVQSSTTTPIIQTVICIFVLASKLAFFLTNVEYSWILYFEFGTKSVMNMEQFLRIIVPRRTPILGLEAILLTAYVYMTNWDSMTALWIVLWHVTMGLLYLALWRSVVMPMRKGIHQTNGIFTTSASSETY